MYFSIYLKICTVDLSASKFRFATKNDIHEIIRKTMKTHTLCHALLYTRYSYLLTCPQKALEWRYAQCLNQEEHRL